MNLHNILIESIFGQLILEAKTPEQMLDLLFKKYGDEVSIYEIKSIMDIDPTKKYSYTQWALSKLVQSDEYSDFSKINNDTIDALKNLFDFAQGNKNFQLQTFNSISEAKSAMEEFLGKSQYDVVYEDDEWIVYVPQTYEAERYIVWHLYDGASWCTAANSESGRHYFDKYNEGNYRLYINANKYSEEIYQYSPQTGEFNDRENYAVDDFDELGITEGLAKFYDEKLGVDFVAIAKERNFDENAEEIGGTGVFLLDDQLWLSYDKQLSDGNNDYFSINSFVSSYYVILAPIYGTSSSYDIYVNQDSFTGEHKGWHLLFENAIVEEFDGSDSCYITYKNYFGLFFIDEGWDCFVDGVVDAEPLDLKERSHSVWIITKEDDTKSIYSDSFSECDYEYGQDNMEHDGLYGFAEFFNFNAVELFEDYGEEGWASVTKENFKCAKKIFNALNYSDKLNVKMDENNENLVIIYEKDSNIENNEEEFDASKYAKEIGEYLGVQYGVEGNIPYLLIPKNIDRQTLNKIHFYLKSDLGGYKMMKDADENTFKVNIMPYREYSMAENIKKKFNTILEKISKRY